MGSLIGLALTATENLLHVQVSDPGSAFTAPHLSEETGVQPGTDTVNGRGLFIVDELSERRWRAREHGHGRTVRCAIPASGSCARRRSPAGSRRSANSPM
ncbi:anti-sigma regulatory factor (Ser/Thr protein kinase) [Streptosporangium album]|uniref:Anti-sigma regulatory factor (Ser/Thr protein kinase) n=1 Tax=Streptosporangium album TaxID=47479 RepID=A0A7W7W7E7_9ACTN|nr:anti-sigma regulatory factor (Ser/Thr protein kinase) [Streptosporangium album]